MGDHKKVIVVGLDGATFDLLEPWIKNGDLPNLAQIYNNGAKGKLISTIPPWTAPAWISFSTGVNPGKHGVYDFFKVKNYKKKLISSKDIKVKQIWEILSELGKNVIVVNPPAGYPPSEVNGVLISGLLTPSLESNFVHPPELKDAVLKMGYQIGVELEPGGRANAVRSFSVFEDDKKIRSMVEIFNQVEEKRAEVALRLMKEYEWDFVYIVFDGVDRIQHYFWNKPHVILEHYKKLDQVIGKFIERADEQTYFVVISDHGFGAVKKKIFINSILMDMGLAIPKRTSGWKSLVLKIGRKIAELIAQTRFPIEKILNSKLIFRFYCRAYEPSFDFTKTKAYMLNETSQGIWINLAGREPEGIVPQEEYESIRDKIVQKLNTAKDLETGVKVVRAYKREEIYFGQYVSRAPDIILQVASGYTIEPTLEYSFKLKADNFLRKVKKGEQNASHRMDGILMVHGPKIKSIQLSKPAYVYDIMSTILTLLEIQTPKRVDGVVIGEILGKK